MDPNLIRNAGTAGLGLAVLLAGLAAWFWVGRRRFQRRNNAGIEEFGSYGTMILTAGFEKLTRIVAALAVIAGLLLSARAVNSNQSSLALTRSASKPAAETPAQDKRPPRIAPTKAP